MMPFEKVDPKVDFPALEREILAFWDRTSAFDKLREINRGRPKWSFLDGPITANNPMGVHHAWGRTYKDIYQRFNASLGRELRYQNGFDCQGLWVEVEVEKERGFTCKKDIEGYGIGKFVEECKARAHKFAAQQSQQSQRLGYWMDWDNSYYTMSDENNYGIWAVPEKVSREGPGVSRRGCDAVVPAMWDGPLADGVERGLPRSWAHFRICHLPADRRPRRKPPGLDHYPVDAELQRGRRSQAGHDLRKS
jgi:isoleucyl-tRNA synthetase